MVRTGTGEPRSKPALPPGSPTDSPQPYWHSSGCHRYEENQTTGPMPQPRIPAPCGPPDRSAVTWRLFPLFLPQCP